MEVDGGVEPPARSPLATEALVLALADVEVEVAVEVEVGVEW